MSVTVNYAATLTVAEVPARNTGSAPANTGTITHTSDNQAHTLSAGTTPPATDVAAFTLTLTAGAATIDLRALTGTNGAVVDGNGLKVQSVQIKNNGANLMTFKVGATNGHTGIFGATTGLPVQPGGEVLLFSNDNGDDIDATHRNWDVTGTAAQAARVKIVLG
jgi:hypothetical protein